MKELIFKAVITIMVICTIICSITFFAFASNNTAANNTIVTAENISTNTQVYSCTNGDKNYYKFTINSSGYIQIALSHEYNVVSHIIYLKQYDGTNERTLLYHKVSYQSEISVSEKFGLPAGSYYVEVYSGTNKDTGYSLEIKFTESDVWEKEENNDVAHANDININTQIYGCTKGNADYYKFTVDYEGYIQIIFNHDYNSVSHAVYIKEYDGTEESNLLYLNAKYESEISRSETIALPSGTYYVKVFSGSDHPDDYSFTVACSQGYVEDAVQETTTMQAHDSLNSSKSTNQYIQETVRSNTIKYDVTKSNIETTLKYKTTTSNRETTSKYKITTSNRETTSKYKTTVVSSLEKNITTFGNVKHFSHESNNEDATNITYRSTENSEEANNYFVTEYSSVKESDSNNISIEKPTKTNLVTLTILIAFIITLALLVFLMLKYKKIK